MHVVFSSVVSMTFLLFLLSFEMKTKTQNEDVKQTNKPKKKPKQPNMLFLDTLQICGFVKC